MPTASPPHTKHCPRCEQSKPVADFGRNKATGDGLAGYCKACAREYSREWRARNQPRLDDYEVRHSSGKRCHRCGETKTVDEFAKDATKGSGRKSICKPCDNEKSRLYYLAKQGGYRKRSHEDARQEQGCQFTVEGRAWVGGEMKDVSRWLDRRVF